MEQSDQQADKMAKQANAQKAKVANQLFRLDEMVQLTAISPATRKFFAIFQYQDVFTRVAGLQLFDLAHVGEDGAVDTDERAGNQLRANATDALSHQVAIFPAMHADVIGGRFNPVNLIYVQKDNASAGPDYEPV